MTESRPTASTTETTAGTDVTQDRQSVARLGERILVERIHRALDEGGVAGHLAFCTTTLPYLQGVAALLPRLADGSHAAALEAFQTLNAGAQARGLSLRDALAEATDFYDRLRQDVMNHLKGDERMLVNALNGLNRTLMEAWREAALARQTPSSPPAARSSHIDDETGLANRQYFEERFGEEILRAQRLQKTLTLVLLEVDRAAMSITNKGMAADDALVRGMAAALLVSVRGFDLAARLDGDRFALLLPETSRAGAAAILSRMARGTDGAQGLDQSLRFRAGIAVYPKDGETVHALLQHADSVLQQWTATA